MKVIGVDIGGTEIKGSIIDHSGNVHAGIKAATNLVNGREGILKSLFTVIDALIKIDPEISGIGVGTAGLVNPRSGEILNATENLPEWQGTRLVHILEERYHKASFIENDANAALLGEVWQGLNKSYGSVTMITLGTGVGGANMNKGKLLNGGNYQGGEWGHVILIPYGRPCNCGMKGCIEQYISGKALVQLVKEATNKEFLHGRDIFVAFSNGDEQVQQVVSKFIGYLALTIYNITKAIDPEAVIIGGGVIDSKEYWWSVLKNELVRFRVTTDVLPAQLGNKAGMFGAAKLVFDALQKKGGLQ